jgi:pimeloyl-ACP methyl ester carboxylesterase
MSVPTSPHRTGVPIKPVTTMVRGIPLSGLAGIAAEPRGVLLAIHGGGTRAGYFHGSTHPDQSLMTLAHTLGYSVLAIDRPGHGSSHGHVGDMSIDQRADLVAEAAEILAGGEIHRVGTVVVAHSLGCQLACHLAASGKAGVVGLELSGSGLHYRANALDDSPAGNHPDFDAERVHRVMDRIWGSPAMYPPGTRRSARQLGSISPPTELTDARQWLSSYAEIAARITVPVRITMGEIDGLWSSTEEDLAELAGLFSASPRVRYNRQYAGPRNLSLSWSARAYHLNVLAFAEECLLAARGIAGLQANSRQPSQRLPRVIGRRRSVERMEPVRPHTPCRRTIAPCQRSGLPGRTITRASFPVAPAF